MGYTATDFETAKIQKKEQTPKPSNQTNIFSSLKEKHLQENFAAQKRRGFAEYVESKERDAFEKSLM